MQAQQFLARDGIELSYLLFDHSTPRATLVLLHGSTYNAKRYANIAKAANRMGFRVLLSDWRGHGQSQGRPGDCDYVGQLEDDLADLLRARKDLGDLTPVVLAGHSAGAVVCLRYVNRYGCDDIDGLVMIAPAINAPLEAVRYEQPSAAWQFKVSHFRTKPPAPPVDEKALAMALKFAPTIDSRKFWLAKLLPFLRHRTVLSFPANGQMAKLEGRILDYSYNLMMACDIADYPAALGKITVPVLLLAGEQDEILHPDFLSTVYHWHLDHKLDRQLILLPNINHMGVLSAAAGVVPKWLDQHFGGDVEQGAVA